MPLAYGLSASISFNNWASGLPEPLAIIDIDGEGLHTGDRYQAAPPQINSMKGVKPRS